MNRLHRGTAFRGRGTSRAAGGARTGSGPSGSGRLKSYLSLIPISARVNKKKNRMTILCITLSVFLVTAIFSMADMELRSQKIRAIADYGNWHIVLRGISDADAARIGARDDVAASGWYAALNFRLKDDYFIGSKRAAICGIEQAIATDILAGSITEGRYPQSSREILLTENARDSLNVRPGDSIALQSPGGEDVFAVSGFVATTAMASKLDAVVALMPMETYSRFYAAATQATLEDSDRMYYVQFRESCNVRKAIAAIREAHRFTDEQIKQNTALLGVMGMSDDSFMRGLYLTAAVLFLFVLTAGVLMIASSMNSNVAQRTAFFGMMRCTGASKKQIMRFVRLEALNWCSAAIPAGIWGGVAVTWALCAALKSLSPSYFGDMPVFAVSLGGMAAGAVMGVLTVVIAAQSPAKRAARVSPVAAVSGNASDIHPIRRAPRVGVLKIDAALGIHHATQNKKSFLLMVGSFAFSIVLFLSFSALIAFMNHAITPLKPYTPDLSIVSKDNACTIDRSLAERLAGMSGVKRVYGRGFAYGIPAKFGGTQKAVTLISYESHQFGWIDRQGWAQDREGLQRAAGDSGQGQVLAVYSPEISIAAGDVISTALGDLTVATVVSHVPFDRSDGEETLICSEALFTKLTGSDRYTIIDIQLERSTTDADVRAIRSLAQGYSFSDRRLSNRETKGAFYSFALFIYGFLAIIAMIAAFNIVNSISMSVSSRIRQYGAMRAVGMSIRQLTNMVTAEALAYAVCGCLAGIAIGLPVHRFLYGRLVTARWGDAWEIPLAAMAVMVALILLTTLASVHPPAKRMRSMAITATINEL